jgi:V/A-type H+-transporting ATPase subunit I
MIVPMKKYTFLVHHAGYGPFLEDLRELGVLHVQTRGGEPSEPLLERMQVQKEIRDTLTALRRRQVQAPESVEKLKEISGTAIVRSFQTISDRRESLVQERQALEKEIGFLKPWGSFSVETLEKLREAGLRVRFLVCPARKFDPEWARKYPLEVVRTAPPDQYFVVITQGDEDLDIEAEEVPAPAIPLDALIAKQEVLDQKIAAMDAELDRYALHGQAALEAALAETEADIQLISVIDHTRREAEDAVMMLEGFVPVSREAELVEYCEREQVLFLSERPRPVDRPPVLLKNSSFARLFEPIGSLFALPSYGELDLTPYFAPFFMMFFGFCLGDAGYGVVVLLGATLYKRRAKPNMRPVVTLAQYLGLATIIFGVLTGTVFGMNLLEERYAWLGDVRSFMLNSDQAFQMALVLGMVQILFGLVLQGINRAKQFGPAYAIVTVGWLILLLSLLDLALLKLTGKGATYGAWAGVGLILLFNDPKAGIFARLGKGVWELYGITGFFGDLLSYIRLFALGISSAILGFVVNDISMQIRDGIPYLGPVLFVLFLVVGHGANLLIASLGAFVHPLRLTFVEFYKNAGFTGGGKAYRPFSRKKLT